MHFRHQLSILKNKLLNLQANSSNDAALCISMFRKIRQQMPMASIRRTIGAAAFAVLLQLVAPNTQAQNRATFNFGTPQFNPFGLQSIPNASVTLPSLGDLDNDGDIDMVVAYLDTISYSSKFLYIKNEGSIGNPSFSSPSDEIYSNPIISNDFPINAPALVDLDGDGDLDIVVGAYDYDSYTYNGKFIYYQNIGTAANPQYAEGVDNPFELQPSMAGLFWFPTFADIDGDGDQDMVASSYYAGTKFFKNSGSATSPQFDEPIDMNTAFEITQPINFVFPFFADLDNDADIDLFITDYYDGKFMYFENTGTTTAPAFAAVVNNPDNLTYSDIDLTPNFVKFDNDADLEMFSGSYTGIVYRENLQFAVGVKNVVIKSIQVAPTVSNDVINVLNLKNAIQQVTVYNMLGQVTQVDYSGTSISIQSLIAGQYHLRIIDSAGEVYTAPFIKQ